MSGVPTRSTTHRDIEFGKLASLGLEIEDMADGEPVTQEQIAQLANDRGRPVSHYLAASVLATEVEMIAEAPIQAVFCAGKCQSWGALDCIDRAVELREKHPGFDVVPRQCLDKCEHAAVCEIRTPDGTATITIATPAKVEAALKEALGL
jgi:hypothetical protein